MRIAVGGFQHETNTFAAHGATYADFVAPDAWPGLTRGPSMLEALHGINLPAAGFIAEALSAGHRVAPLTWCSATPSGYVARDAYERIAGMLLDDLRRDLHIDAVYLDLHGAMAAEHVDDADGELLRRVRNLIGPAMPLVASVDFHANVSAQMVEHASVLVAYRTYPHTDMAGAGARALRALLAARGRTPARALQRPPFLIPLTSQCTLVEPLVSLIRETQRLETGGVAALNFTPGFPAADVPECGPAVFAYGEGEAPHAAAREVAALVEAHESRFALDVYTVEDAMRELERSPRQPGRPVILADTQDNPGGGGTAESTSLIKALLERRQPRVLAGLLCDPQAAALAHAAGVGAALDLALGASSNAYGETPIRGRFRVSALSDGRFTATGPFYLGARMDLGPMALLSVDDVHIAVASRKQQAADQAMFRTLNVEPQDFAVLVLKSSVHFRADFGAMAERILVVAAPGPNLADPSLLPFTKLPPEVRKRPRR